MKQMKKKTTAAWVALLLVVFLCIPAVTAQAAGEAGTEKHYRLMDMADLLSDEEEADLLYVLDEISERQKLAVVIATTDTLDGSDIVDYADDLYDNCDYGYGADKDGIMLLISMEERDWYVTTSGYGITVFTDAGIKYIGNRITEDLSEGNYAAAFTTFIETCDTLITQARTGKSFDKSDLPRKPMSAIWIPISLAVGTTIAFIIVEMMKASLKTVRAQEKANVYVRDGSMNITQSHDLFLFRNVKKTKREKEASSRSRTHTSSSGRRHGGGGGKF